jgi:16S rRNA C1402 (ribose-2'-O) methylase RsmI
MYCTESPVVPALVAVFEVVSVEGGARQRHALSCLIVGCTQREGVVASDLSKSFDRQNDRQNMAAVKSQDRQQKGSCLIVGCTQREGVVVSDLTPKKFMTARNMPAVKSQDRQQKGSCSCSWLYTTGVRGSQ